jgi:hypothetical protein
MARLLALDDCALSLKNNLLRSLRSLDEAVLLPQSERNAETANYKNIVFRLVADEGGTPIDIFNSNWYSGISAIKLPDCPVLNDILRDPRARKTALKRMRDAIPSESADSSIEVGPGLDCTKLDQDVGEWIAGFDGPQCCVGLYAAEHSQPPEVGKRGMSRVVKTFYLVVKSGGGLAASTFHSRLISALKKGNTLEECLERGDPGPQALRRVALAGSRNRARILLLAANALGLTGVNSVDTVPDQSSQSRYRCAVAHVDVNCNTLRKVDGLARPVYQYTTAMDALASLGLMSCSNVADGFVLFLSPEGDVRQSLRNDAHCALPFASNRILGEKDAVAIATKSHKEAARSDEPAHVDSSFIRDVFAWKNRDFGKNQGDGDVDIEPLPLWGTHSHENFVSKFSRELGISNCQLVRLRPECVLLSGIEPGKLRAAVRSIEGAVQRGVAEPKKPKPAEKAQMPTPAASLNMSSIFNSLNVSSIQSAAKESIASQLCAAASSVKKTDAAVAASTQPVPAKQGEEDGDEYTSSSDNEEP